MWYHVNYPVFFFSIATCQDFTLDVLVNFCLNRRLTEVLMLSVFSRESFVKPCFDWQACNNYVITAYLTGRRNTEAGINVLVNNDKLESKLEPL